MIQWPLKLDPVPVRGYPKPDHCKDCAIYGNGRGFGLPDWNGNGNGVLLVGESSGEHEAAQGKFFVGPSGWQLNHVFKRGGFQRENFAGIDSVLHCQPPGNKLSGQPYEDEAIRHCSPYLDDTIHRVFPRAIVALGGTALKRLTGLSGITRNRGFIIEGSDGIPVVGTFHPSYLLPKKGEKAASKYTWVMIMDIRKALRVAQGKRDLYPQQYLMDPHPDKAIQFMNEYTSTPGITMAWDLETLYKLKQKNEQKLELDERQTITRISYSWRPGYAMTIPWIEPYISQVIIPIFEMNRPKVGWNSKGFDEPIVILQEHINMGGVLYDAMDQFHTFQPNIERGLEFATSILCDHLGAWKHRSQSDPEWYSCVDSDATITNHIRLNTMMSQVEVPDYGS